MHDMARRRMIDPNFWQSEDIAKLNLFERLIFIGMFSNADDEGRGRANPNYLKSIIFPYDEIRTADMEKALINISNNTSVVFYKDFNNKYYAFKNWDKWQRVDKPQKSTIPPFQEQFQEPFQEPFLPNIKEEKRREDKRKEEKEKETDKPSTSPHMQKKQYGEFGNVILTDDEYARLSTYCNGKHDYYIQSVDGYLQQNPANKKKYKDHYATVRNWYRRDNPKVFTQGYNYDGGGESL